MDQLKDSNGAAHVAGDAHCTWCACEYPLRCRCGGLIHGSDTEESYDAESGDITIFVLFQRCDQCGEDWEEATSPVESR